MCQQQYTEQQVQEILTSFKREEREIIPILQRIQEDLGYLSEEAMLAVAKFVFVPESKIYATATFYAQFRFKPVGRNHIAVCRGTACHVRGAERIQDALERQLGIKEGETSEDLEHTLEAVACIGCCALAPAITINNQEVHGQLTPKKVAELFPAAAAKEAN
ncbi:MAG: NADH-quinone oxidoreductase subunit NuoE [Clostridia bacterium]|jgi:NADH-quinone oxidoreductase subunit E|nr:NADH-quinone oxidoreductase subunit NuoE [Clostridia bacterium]